MAPRRTTNLWAYLESSGVLVTGDAQMIAAAKQQYRKTYLKAYKQKQREQKPEFLVQLSRKDGEVSRIVSAAKKHQLSVTAFLREATLAYIDRRYLLPDRIVVGKLVAILESCLNEIRTMTSSKIKSAYVIDERYEAIEKRITTLENEINQLICHPQLLERAVAEAIQHPHTYARLKTILANAHRENQDIQETEV